MCKTFLTTNHMKNAITYKLTTYLCSSAFMHLSFHKPAGSTEAIVSKPA